MKWSNVRLIFARELRDQLRDRRTLLTILALPLLLYPLLGMTYLQMAQFLKESPTRIWILGTDHLPATPPLLDDSGKLFPEKLFPKEKQSLLELTTNPRLPDGVSQEQLLSHATETIESGEQEIIVYFPQNFADQLKTFREAVARYRTEDISLEDMEKVTVPAPIIYINTASDKSQLGFRRTDNILREWRQSIVKASFLESRIPAQASTPFQLEQVDVARTASKQAAVWSKILPFFALVWALAGAFYPAVDLCAGEKERGTLETLLCSPADRREIVWGKCSRSWSSV
ncbi:MAG: ABC transporter permease subunit, partial [Pirellulaceae bacterium]|nr:ABC transporter permease subunit [Pirellulaceae bacterium]